MLSGIKYVNGPYRSKKNKGRKYVSVVYEGGRKRFVSYPKFLVECLLERELDPVQETVDHIDRNFDNNDWQNLRLVDLSQHTSDDVERVERIKVKCIWCGKKFRRQASRINVEARRKKAGPFCGKQCSGSYGAALRRGDVEELPPIKPVQLDKVRHYRRTKKRKRSVADYARDRGILLPTEKEITETFPRFEREEIEETCQHCGDVFYPPQRGYQFCSVDCKRQASRKVERPSKAKLKKLVWKYPTTKLAKRFGVSDAAITKWCKQYRIKKPPRGYWSKRRE